MKLVKAHGNAELVNGPRIPKRKTEGTQEPISKKKPVAIPGLSHYSRNNITI